MHVTEFISEAEFALLFAKLGTLLLIVAGLFAIVPANWAKRIFAHLLVMSMVSFVLSQAGPAFLDEVPLVVLFGFAILIALSLLRFLLMPFLGRGGADSAVGNLFATLLLSVFLPLLLPFKLLKRLLGGRD